MTAWYDVSMLPDEREVPTGGNRHDEARGTDNMVAHADVYAPALVMQGIGMRPPRLLLPHLRDAGAFSSAPGSSN